MEIHPPSPPSDTSPLITVTTTTSSSSSILSTSSSSSSFMFHSLDSPEMIQSPSDNEVEERELIAESSKPGPNQRFYEVYFTCFVGTYHTSKYTLTEGDFVIVQADRGHDIGVVNRLVEFEVSINQENNEIVSVVPKDEFPVRAMLQDKVIAQNQALEICRNKCVELLINTHIEVIATEFQFDRKKLTLYYKKHSDVSVCKLIRKLYNIFKMRIWMEPIDVELSNDSFSNITAKFLSLSQITIPPQEKSEALPAMLQKKDSEPPPSSSSPLVTKTISSPVEATRRESEKVVNHHHQQQQHYQYQSAPIAYNKNKNIINPSIPGSSVPHHTTAANLIATTSAVVGSATSSRNYAHAPSSPQLAVQPPSQYYRHADQHQYRTPQQQLQHHQHQHQPRTAAPPGYNNTHNLNNNNKTRYNGNHQYSDYDRNYARDSYNYRDHQYTSTSPYDYDYDVTSNPHVGSLSRQERIDRYVEMAEDPYHQYNHHHNQHHQQQQQLLPNHHQYNQPRNYSKYQETANNNNYNQQHYQQHSSHHARSYPHPAVELAPTLPSFQPTYQNEDTGRYLSNGLLEDDNMTASSGDSLYEYSNFMPQSTFTPYYHQG